MEVFIAAALIGLVIIAAAVLIVRANKRKNSGGLDRKYPPDARD